MNIDIIRKHKTKEQKRTGKIIKGGLTVIGEYVRLRCGNCDKWISTWTQTKYFSVDCTCTLQETGSGFRTTNI